MIQPSLQIMNSKETRIHTAKDIKKGKDNSITLEIVLDGKTFNLPVINVGGELHPEYIAILDPREPELGEAGANVLAELLKELDIDLIITAPSLKAKEMIIKANEKANIEDEPVIVIGGSVQAGDERYIFSKEEVVDLASPNGEKFWIEECRPITLGPDDPSKFYAINEEIIQKIIESIKQGKKLALVDDVYSTGATINSLKKIISRALSDSGIIVPSIPIIVVAREALGETEIFEDRDALAADNQALNLYAAILIPVLLENPEI